VKLQAKDSIFEPDRQFVEMREKGLYSVIGRGPGPKFKLGNHAIGMRKIILNIDFGPRVSYMTENSSDLNRIRDIKKPSESGSFVSNLDRIRDIQSDTKIIGMPI
jgi:hypothetical protein